MTQKIQNKAGMDELGEYWNGLQLLWFLKTCSPDSFSKLIIVVFNEFLWSLGDIQQKSANKNLWIKTCWQKSATLRVILKNTRTCLAKQDQAGSYTWVTMINNLNKECNWVVNLSITRTYCTKLYIIHW